MIPPPPPLDDDGRAMSVKSVRPSFPPRPLAHPLVAREVASDGVRDWPKEAVHLMKKQYL